MMDVLDNPEKTFTTLQARGALLGVRVLRCHDGRNRPVYFVCQGVWSRELQSMQAVEQLLDRMEGRG